MPTLEEVYLYHLHSFDCLLSFQYKVDCKLTIEFLGNNYADGNGTPPNQSEKWTSYCGRYAKSGTKDKDEVRNFETPVILKTMCGSYQYLELYSISGFRYRIE